MSTTPLLAVRHAQKRRKPLFVVKEAHHGGGRVKWRWRAARGIHSYVRQMHRGRPAMPTPGFGAPKAVYGLHPTGLEPIVVHTISQLVALNPTRQGAILASTLGQKRRFELLNVATSKKIMILNVRDTGKAIEKISAAIARRKQAKQKRLVTKQQKLEEKKSAGQKKNKEKNKEKDHQKSKNAQENEGAAVSAEVTAEQIQEKEKQEKEFAEKIIIQKT